MSLTEMRVETLSKRNLQPWPKTIDPQEVEQLVKEHYISLVLEYAETLRERAERGYYTYWKTVIDELYELVDEPDYDEEELIETRFAKSASQVKHNKEENGMKKPDYLTEYRCSFCGNVQQGSGWCKECGHWINSSDKHRRRIE